MQWMTLMKILKLIGIKIDNNMGLIDYIKNKTFTEELGTSYIEDVNQKESNIEEYGEEYRFFNF